jgi:hypothetical protein
VIDRRGTGGRFEHQTLRDVVKLRKLLKVDIEVEIHLYRFIWTPALAVAVHIVLKLPALSKNLVSAVCRCYFHERPISVQIIPLSGQRGFRSLGLKKG